MTVSAPTQRTSPWYELTIDNATGELALRCPYEDRDAAKRLGARWHKTWDEYRRYVRLYHEVKAG